jgi:PAS domain S-box-containing protein
MNADFDLILFHQTIIERMNALVIFLSPKGTVLFWNEAAEKITGYAAEEVIGTAAIWKQLYPDPIYRKKITGMIIGVIEEQAYLRNFETRVLTKTGEKKHISWNTSEVRTTDGSITGYVAVGIDITEKVVDKRKLRDREELFHGITSAAYDGIVLLDDAGRIAYWNPSAEWIFSLPMKEAKGQRAIDLIAPPGSHSDWEDALTRDGVHELTGLRGDGGLVPVEVTLSGVTLRDLPHTIMIVRDISKRLEAEAQMRLLSAIVHSSEEAIISVGADGHLLSWNPAAERICGIPYDTAIGGHIADNIRLKNDDRAITDAIVASVHTEIAGVLIDTLGVEHDVVISLTPIQRSDRFSLLIRDVTKEKKAAKTMIAYIKEATMRLNMPVLVVRENLEDIIGTIEGDTADCEAATLRLKVQIAHLARISETIRELNAALTGEGREIPEAYRSFLLE